MKFHWLRLRLRMHAALVVAAAAVFASTARADIEQQPTPEQPPAAPATPVMTKPPALVTTVEPAYPDAARSENRTGDVTLLMTIDATGAVTDATVKTSSGSVDLDDAAVAAAKQFTFSPAEIDGAPGACAIEYVQHFTLAAPEPPAPPPTEAVVTTAAPTIISVDGLVRAAVTKQALADVEVTLDANEDAAVVSDEDGRFSITNVAAGEHRITLAASGWTTSFVDVVVEDGKRTDVIAYLEPRDANAFETVVREKRALSEVTRVTLTRDELKSVPGTFGDPLRVLENLPGMQRSSFAGGQLLVRGSNPEDSSVLFDGIPIPQLYHFQGLKSVVNPEFLEDINFYPGGFPAKYGRAIGGVVDVTSRELPADAFRGSVDVNLLDASFFLSLPLDQLGVPHTTVAMAARRSYIDALLPSVLEAVTPPGGQAIAAVPVYWDYQTKLETRLDAHKLALFAFGSSDALKVETQGLGNNVNLALNAGQQFHRLAGRWTWNVGDGVTNMVQPFVGVTNTSVSGGGNGFDLGVDGGSLSWGLRDELKLHPLDSVRASIGIDYLGDGTSSDVVLPFSPTFGGFPTVVPSRTVDGQEIKNDVTKNSIALWAQSEVDVVPGLMIVPGVRAEMTRVSYAPQVDDDGNSTAGSDSDLSAVDPRVAIRYELFPKLTTLTASGGLFHEPPPSSTLSPSTGNPDLVQQSALQLIGGVEQRLTEDLGVTFQTYVTQRYNLVQTTTADGAPPAAARNAIGVSGSTTTPDNDGTGYTYGAELMLRHDISKSFYGWVAYTLSRTMVDVDPSSKKLTLSPHDQTHILTVVAQGKLPWGFSLGGRFRYVTGDPTAAPAGSFHDVDTGSYTQLSSGSDTRLPDFIQLDARIDRKWVFDNLSLTAFVDVQNVTNNQNVEGVVADYRNVTSTIIPGLPILPIVGINAEF